MTKEAERVVPISQALGMLGLPPLLLKVINDGKWPKQPVSCNRLSERLGLLHDEHLKFSFSQSVEEMLLGPDLATLKHFLDAENFANDFKLAQSSKAGTIVSLPWLDLDWAVPIGGGADIGDDLWLILDYRVDKKNPRIVSNRIRVYDGGPAWGEYSWYEVARDFNEFWTILDT